MNSQITKLFAVIVLLFGVLIYFTSRWTVFSATALNDNALNSRPQIAQLRIKRGRILADDGTVLAERDEGGHSGVRGGCRRVLVGGGRCSSDAEFSWMEDGEVRRRHDFMHEQEA